MTIRATNSVLATLPATMSTLLLLLSGCAWQAPVTPDRTALPAIKADVSTASGRAVTIAADQLGIPYRYGGATPNKGFDCSGLVYYAYRQAGLKVPRTSAAQYSATNRISLADARPGDLLFFASRRSVDHVAIYVGDNKFIHAPYSGTTVMVGRMSDAYYRDHFVGAGQFR